MTTMQRSTTTSATRGRALIAGATALAALALPVLAPALSQAAPAKPVVSTEKTSLGQILIGPNGHTLYQFAKDKGGKSACSGQCATFWPPLIASGKPAAGAGVKASLLGTVKRADGRTQVTYAHHPLYTFAKDTKKGQTNGEEVDAFGAEWYVTSPAGAKVEKSHDPKPAAPTTGGFHY
jgi:predicted lipoprotein with Yx(FWY)xxD motif